MSETSVDRQIRTETLRDALDFARCWDEIEELREELAGGDDVQLAPSHFLATLDDRWRSCSVACWCDDRLIGLVYSVEHTVLGVGLGYAFGGDYRGRGMLLCRPEHEAAVLQAAVNRTMADGVHSLHLRFLPTDDSKPELVGLDMSCMDGIIEGDRIALLSSFDEFLGKLGKHTRRNIRYYTRKAIAAGIEFVPSLTKAEYLVGVERINTEAKFPAKSLRLARDERLLLLHHNSQRQGLRGPDGNLVAVLCGFTRGSRFHLLTQLNDAHFSHLSLSMVLRGYCVLHLLESGHTELQFISGTSMMFSPYCVPQMYRSIYIDKKNGVALTAKRVFSQAVKWAGRSGRSVPAMLQTLCGGCLEEWRLIERSALTPAAIVAEKERKRLSESAQTESVR